MEDQILNSIEKYFNNQLNQSEKLEFEKRLESSVEFQKEFKAYQLAHQSIELSIAKNTKAQFNGWSQNKHGLTVKKQFAWKQIATIAASFIILFGGLHFYASNEYSNDSLIEQFASLGSNKTRGETSTGESPLQAAIKQISSSPENALVALEKLNVSTTELESKEIIEWNIILCNLKMGKVDIAKNLLNSIIQNEQHSFNKKAIKLLSKLNSNWRLLQ